MRENRAYVRTDTFHEQILWRDKRPLLGHLDLELTERCNNSCIHCLINQPENDAAARSREMETSLVKAIIRQAAELGCLSVTFTGGEPLLRDDFMDLYLFTRRLGMQVSLFTNARRITPELAQLFSRIPPGQVVEVSVYGMRAASYDAVTVSQGAFAEFRRGIELLREYNVPFIVKQSILPPNRAEIAEFENFAATLPFMGELPVYTMNFDLRTRRDNSSKNRSINNVRLTPDETVAILARNPRRLKEMREFAGKFLNLPGDRLFTCGAGLGAWVDAYGNAQMCMGLREPALVRDLKGGTSTLRQALTEHFPLFRTMRATNPEYLNRCARCFLKGLCEQCPAKSWMEHGTLDTPVTYLCQVAHAQARSLGLITANEDAWNVSDWRERVRRFSRADKQ